MLHPIQVVARRTGLTADVIRAWERRYEAVRPERSPTNRRLYSDDEITRLRLLRLATEAGRRISDVATLDAAELEALIRADRPELLEPGAPAPAPARRGGGDLLEECLQAVEALDSRTLEDLLARAASDLGPVNMLDEVVRPLLEGIGDRWRDGRLRVSHEHMASAVVRTALGALRDAHRASATAPTIVVATPAGQVHELGAMMAAVSAAVEGWHALYLGPDMPADEVVVAVERSGARAAAFSVIYPCDDPKLPDYFRRLRRALPPEIPIFLGGSGAAPYAGRLDGDVIMLSDNASALRERLTRLRLPA